MHIFSIALRFPLRFMSAYLQRCSVWNQAPSGVQVDSSCYAIPSATNVAKWVAATPDDFQFHFKVFGLFCAQSCPLNAVPRRIRETLPSSVSSGGQVRLSTLPSTAVDEVWAAFHGAVQPAKQVRVAGPRRVARARVDNLFPLVERAGGTAAPLLSGANIGTSIVLHAIWLNICFLQRQPKYTRATEHSAHALTSSCERCQKAVHCRCSVSKVLCKMRKHVQNACASNGGVRTPRKLTSAQAVIDAQQSTCNAQRNTHARHDTALRFAGGQAGERAFSVPSHLWANRCAPAACGVVPRAPTT